MVKLTLMKLESVHYHCPSIFARNLRRIRFPTICIINAFQNINAETTPCMRRNGLLDKCIQSEAQTKDAYVEHL